ncbi:MAG: electron transfer flavoprotein subunit beta/FixA family protein [Desulfobacula sp.]|jgi:electron transfer flavoprotein beta subunit|uniref:electron transfer flavoprotein subunit beta/FixA family protein n=1 Tax=Desulfobacula sp. TaxID=2593537 RepID=UPI001DBB79D9|nr:electron transfer flavoprotein subunit beta/FixA family protein [Desulfobacula sp.]MBT4874963.1 electron transfer flavoprotein subunit beta/FixA family protein [Desulfobacula sp.]MBT5546100.1 electron transfer flavoprotein subunit beta/FixA family protein [Desulfobacula sp.]MBT5973650.1 electron transfer flavoprotein subunit beta/FixA family protein [Desulfobacula sp.]MBT7052038.1 electron transfer flavoprotein subunit beta/FixA family protein [Desulfobacula sp.]
MQIYICVKHVPDSAAHITILDKNHIDENISFLLNPYDEHAVTEAVRIKNNYPGAEVIAICFGKNDAEKTIRSAMAMGADRGVLITSDKVHDSIVTALALKTGIEQDGTPGLIFTGKESIDAEGMQTLFRIGALFDFPVATNVVKLDIEQDKAVVDCELSGGVANTYEMSLPCIIGAGRGLNTPRYPTFPDVVKSKKKPVKKISFADLNIKVPLTGMHIVELEPLKQSRLPKEIKGDADIVAKEIVRILKQEAKVI